MRGLAVFAGVQSVGLGAIFGVLLCFGGLSSASAQTTASASGPSAETVVAVVDEKPITLGELIVFRQSLPQAFQDLPDEVLLESLIKIVVDKQILANAAEANRLQQSKSTIVGLKNARRNVLAEAYMADVLSTRVTDDKIAEVYEERYKNATPVPQVRAAHILVDDKTLAQDLMKRLEDGVDFATLAADFGTDLTSARGGDLGWQDTAGLLPAFADAVATMEPGKINGPVQSPFGWHIIRLDGRRDKPVPPFDEVRATIRETLLEEVRAAAIADAKKAAGVKILSDAVPPGAVRNDALIQP